MRPATDRDHRPVIASRASTLRRRTGAGNELGVPVELPGDGYTDVPAPERGETVRAKSFDAGRDFDVDWGDDDGLDV